MTFSKLLLKPLWPLPHRVAVSSTRKIVSGEKYHLLLSILNLLLSQYPEQGSMGKPCD